MINQKARFLSLLLHELANYYHLNKFSKLSNNLVLLNPIKSGLIHFHVRLFRQLNGIAYCNLVRPCRVHFGGGKMLRCTKLLQPHEHCVHKAIS